MFRTPSVFRSFFFYVGLLTAGLLALALPLLQVYEDGLQTQVLISERGLQGQTEQLLHKELFERTADLRILSHAPSVWNFLRQRDSGSQRLLEDYLKEIAGVYHMYSQLRLLDPQGRELIRVNYREGEAQVVREPDLQNKADRYYFKEALKLERGQIYISPLDLNMDNGQVELPYQPTLRLATALHDDQGRVQTVLVLNYNAVPLLDLLRSGGTTPLGQAMLVGADGYWLCHPDAGLEWGGLLKRPEHNFAVMFPQAWGRMQQQGVGDVSVAGGMFLFRRVRPLEMAAQPLPYSAMSSLQRPTHASGPDYAWYLVTFVPKQVWLSRSLFRWPGGWAILAVIWLTAAGGLWALAERRVLQRQLHRVRVRNEEALSDLYENAPCGYHSIDAQGLVIRMNRTELGWLGYTRDEIVGRVRFLDLVTPQSRADLQQCLERFFQEGTVVDHTAVLLCKNGQKLVVSLSATASRDAQGRIVSSRTTVVDMTERYRLEQELQREASTDSLTGAFNRREFHRLAEREISRAKREGRAVSLLMLDIDFFKKVNDRHGHAAGDEVLKQVAQTCSAQLRGHDVFARMGGEEFVALLTQSGAAASAQVAERIRAAVEAMDMVLEGGQKLRVTVSVGVASDEKGQQELEVLLHQADANLYRAKDNGRNQVCV